MKRLREEHVAPAFDEGVPAEALVGGLTAEVADFYGIVDLYTPIVFAFVLGLSFVILMMVFRSIVIPIKAIIMNLLSVGATYGLLVIVFQKGVGADLFGFQRAEVIDAWLPLFLFTILFGLSMDYHVFLLSRIRERYDETEDNTEAVAYGLRSTAGIITGAALIMVVVFGAFAGGRYGGEPADGLRAGHSGAAGRDAGALGAGPGQHGGAGQGQLVPAVVAGLASRPAGGGSRRGSCPRDEGCRVGPMQIPSDYVDGYEKARTLEPEIASNYVAPHDDRRPGGRRRDRGARIPRQGGGDAVHQRADGAGGTRRRFATRRPR